MGAFDRILTRAARLPGSGAGLGNAAPGTGYTGQGGSGRSGKGPLAGTRSITYSSPGQPQAIDAGSDNLSQENYLGSVYVMRCCRLIAETLAALPFVAGMDPFDPGAYNPDAPLARLLGPATPRAPGGPNRHLSSRAFWIWTIVQYITSGRWGWEMEWDGKPMKSNIVGLWPLVSTALAPIPIDGKAEIWAGFQYQTPTGVIPLPKEKVMYAWRPSIIDWRMPESVLQAASNPIYIHRAIDRYTVNLLKNNMVASTMIIAPPVEEMDQRRAWEEQFLSEYTGVDRAGSTIFGYIDGDKDDPPGTKMVQVEHLAQTAMESSLMELSTTAKNDINIATGVPRSLLGDASQRIYSNAGAEYRNYWVITMLNIVAEAQEHVNLRLAPLVGDEVGWFDLSKVEALQPPSVFMPPDVGECIQMGVLTAEQAASVLGIPPPGDQGDSDTDTVMQGEEATQSGSIGGRAYFGLRSPELDIRFRAWAEDHIPQNMWRQFKGTVPMNVDTYRRPTARTKPVAQARVGRPRLVIRSTAGFDAAQAITERTAGLRAVAMASRLATTVHKALAKHYPESTLDWVDGADWSGPQTVDLAEIKMDRRPGGRDMAKVDGIAKAQADGVAGALAPVILVETPSGVLKVGDGYHRTLATKRRGKGSIQAYVGKVDSEDGPWDREMHEKKLNRAIEARVVGIRAGWSGPADSVTQPELPQVVDVKTALDTPQHYELEDVDPYNGVPAPHIEALGHLMAVSAPAPG